MNETNIQPSWPNKHGMWLSKKVILVIHSGESGAGKTVPANLSTRFGSSKRYYLLLFLFVLSTSSSQILNIFSFSCSALWLDSVGGWHHQHQYINSVVKPNKSTQPQRSPLCHPFKQNECECSGLWSYRWKQTKCGNWWARSLYKLRCNGFRCRWAGSALQNSRSECHN